MTKTTAVHPPPAAEAVSYDLPCLACGYNLRGLSPTGNCPECYFSVDSTLRELADRFEAMGPPLWTGDRRRLTDLTEGAALVMFVLVLMVAFAFAPDSWWMPQAGLRAVMLGVACTAWVLSWLAAWKLARPESDEDKRRGWWLRGSATLYMTMPFWAGLAPPYNAGAVWITLILVSLAGGAIAGPVYYVVVRTLGWRLRSRRLPIPATVLAVLTVFVLLASLLPSGHGGTDSLSMMINTRTVQLGSIESVRYALRMWRGGWPHPLEWLVLVFPLLSAIVNGWLLVLLIGACRRADAHAAATPVR